MSLCTMLPANLSQIHKGSKGDGLRCTHIVGLTQFPMKPRSAMHVSWSQGV